MFPDSETLDLMNKRHPVLFPAVEAAHSQIESVPVPAGNNPGVPAGVRAVSHTEHEMRGNLWGFPINERVNVGVDVQSDADEVFVIGVHVQVAQVPRRRPKLPADVMRSAPRVDEVLGGERPAMLQPEVFQERALPDERDRADAHLGMPVECFLDVGHLSAFSCSIEPIC